MRKVLLMLLLALALVGCSAEQSSITAIDFDIPQAMADNSTVNTAWCTDIQADMTWSSGGYGTILTITFEGTGTGAEWRVETDDPNPVVLASGIGTQADDTFVRAWEDYDVIEETYLLVFRAENGDWDAARACYFTPVIVCPECGAPLWEELEE